MIAPLWLYRLVAELRAARGRRGLRRFLRQVRCRLRARLNDVWRGSRFGRRLKPVRRLRTASRRTAPTVRIAAVGRRARALYGVPPRRGTDRDRQPAVIVADDPATAARMRAPVVALARAPQIAVPAFDPMVHNPVGWPRRPLPFAAALGAAALLPPGTAVDGVLRPWRRRALRRCHRVEDVEAFHTEPATRAGLLARLAADGVLIHLADGGRRLAQPLGAGLLALMCEPVPDDAARREALSVRMRRAALRDHARPARIRQVCEAAGIAPPAMPLVSVLVATRRPAFLRRAVRSVAKQDYPRLELVLGLHGDGFDADVVARAMSGAAIAARIVRVAAERPLGAVLAAASTAARGGLLAKMDDDDLYDRHHVWDLVLAHQYSGAALVGKAAETVYLADADATLRCRVGDGERYDGGIAGGTLLIGRSDLKHAGGWPLLPVGEDRVLVERVRRIGGGVYRTHGFGFVLVRHGQGHAWQPGNHRFRAHADLVRPGWHPSLADIDDEPRFHP